MEIIPGLYIGDVSQLSIIHTLYPPVQLIVNMCPNINSKYPSEEPELEASPHINPSILYINIHDDAIDNYKLLHQIQTTNVLQKIHFVLSSQHSVFVHCDKGYSRSPTLIACYLIQYHDMTVKEAIRFIQTKNPLCFQNGIHFRKTMKHIFKTKNIINH